MSGLFGAKVKSNSSVPPRAAGVNLTTSVFGKPIPLVYGTTRVASNLLLYGNFASQAQYTQGSAASGGKGGGGGGGSASSPQISGYTYSAAVAFALSEGPIKGVGTVWQNKDLHTLADFTDTLFTGTFPQAAWSNSISWTYVDQSGNSVSGSVNTKLGYNGIAYVAFPNFALGNSPSLPNLQFEVKGLLSTTGAVVSTGGDADPSQVLTDVLTNANHGLGFPSAKVGSLTAYQNYCMASGLLVSPAYDSQRTAADIIDELALATNSAPVWTSGKFTFVPYGDTVVSNGGFTFTPSTVIYNLTDNDFIKTPQGGGNVSGGAAGPVVIERKRATDKTNSVKIEFLDRLNSYAPSIAYANDQGLIDNFGLRSNGSRQMHLFCNSQAANLSAHLQLRRLARISNYFFFDLDQRYILLDPMDIVSITDAALGLNQQLVRITQIQENDDGTLSFQAEEYLGTQGQPLFNFGTGAGFNSNPNTPAQAVNLPIIYEPPSALLGGQGTNPQIWIAACGGSTTATDPNWGGANVWLAVPGAFVTYSFFGQITTPARMGYVTAALAAHSGSNPDSTGVLTVDLTESGGVLASGSTNDAQVANTLCLVDNELLSYTTASLVSGNIYNLSGLYRGLYGTANVSHTSGGSFARLDGAIFKAPLYPTYINQPLLVKFTSLNTRGKGLQALASAVAYEYVPGGTALLHPLGQALNVSNVDSGVLTSANAAVFEDYGFIAAQIPEGTLFHMPIGTDLGALGGAFSVQFPAGTGYGLFAQNRVASASFEFAGSTTTGRGSFATWFSRTNSGDSLPQLIMGQADTSTVSTVFALLGNSVAGNVFVGISTSDTLFVAGVINNAGDSFLNTSTQFFSTSFNVASTVVINSSGWHQVTLQVACVSSNSSVSSNSQVNLYLDDVLVASVQLSSGSSIGWTFPGTVFEGNIVSRMVGVSTTSTFAAQGSSLGPTDPIGWNNFAGYLAETYFIDGNNPTSTSFTASSVGPVLTYSNFVGLGDCYLNYANGNGIGLDVSGKNNSMFASTLVTSSNHTLAHP